MSRANGLRAALDFTEAFLTVLLAGMTTAVVNDSGQYVTPNLWAVLLVVGGGVLAGVRKVQARLAGGNTNARLTKPSKVGIAVVLIPLLLIGCGTTAYTQAPLDPIAITADVAAQIVEEAIATNRTYVVQCAAGKITVAKCNEWSRFYARFKEDARLAHGAFHQALRVNDAKTAEEQRVKFREWARQIAELAAYGGK